MLLAASRLCFPFYIIIAAAILAVTFVCDPIKKKQNQNQNYF